MSTRTQDPTTETLPTTKRRRVFMWFFLLVQALFLTWIITGSMSTPAQSEPTMQDAAAVGTAIGVGLIIGLWAIVDVILGITYAVIRLARR